MMPYIECDPCEILFEHLSACMMAVELYVLYSVIPVILKS